MSGNRREISCYGYFDGDYQLKAVKPMNCGVEGTPAFVASNGLPRRGETVVANCVVGKNGRALLRWNGSGQIECVEKCRLRRW